MSDPYRDDFYRLLPSKPADDWFAEAARLDGINPDGTNLRDPTRAATGGGIRNADNPFAAHGNSVEQRIARGVYDGTPLSIPEAAIGVGQAGRGVYDSVTGGSAPAGLDTATLAMAAIPAFRGKNMRPFYGDGVGPKGTIPDPLTQTRNLGLRGGLAGAPTETGFFNPATSALLQGGVAPKQTLTYYQKQMGSRGGKLPPGQWDEATAGWGPRDVVSRDELVKRLDGRTPRVEHRRFVTEDDDRLLNAYPNPGKSGPRAHGEEGHLGYSTSGDFHNYTETAVGYPKAAGPDAPGRFVDDHFAHPNLEGWYRTQDTAYRTAGGQPVAGSSATRILEEVQPQRYQAARDGQPVAQSPFSHDVNDATGFLAKNALRDAAADGIELIAWPHGSVHADRLDAPLAGMTGYYGDGSTPGIMGQNLQSLLRKVGGQDVPVERTALKGADGYVRYPSVELPADIRERIKRTGLPIYSVPLALGGAGVASGHRRED